MKGKLHTFRFLTVVYTCSIPRVNMKYSAARSYACQGGSMLRNLSPGTAGRMSQKLPIYVAQSNISSDGMIWGKKTPES